MKIKQSANINSAVVRVCFLVCTALPVVLRIYHVSAFIGNSAENEAGFFVGGNFTVPLFFVVLAVGCLVPPVLSYLSKDVAVSLLSLKRNTPMCVVSAVTAVALVYDVLQSLRFSLDALSLNDGLYYNNVGSFQRMMKSGSLPLLMESLFAIPAAVFFLVLAVSYGKGKEGSFDKQKRKLLALMPVGWGVLRMIRRFVRQISFLRVSDLLLELFMIGFLLLFLMALAQAVSGIYSEGVHWRLAGFGLPAAMLCLVTSVPRLLFVVAGKTELLNPAHPLYPCDLALAAFIIVLVFTARKSVADTAEVQAQQ